MGPSEGQQVRFTGCFLAVDASDDPATGEFKTRDGEVICFELGLKEIGSQEGLDGESRYALAGQRGATIEGVWHYKGTGGELKSMPDPSAPVSYSVYCQIVPYIDRILAEEAPK